MITPLANLSAQQLRRAAVIRSLRGMANG